jgi:hypothetical protein
MYHDGETHLKRIEKGYYYYFSIHRKCNEFPNCGLLVLLLFAMDVFLIAFGISAFFGKNFDPFRFALKVCALRIQIE